ncbi:MAG TPA: hypothetical protein VGC07_00675 [Granulicella sp.]
MSGCHPPSASIEEVRQQMELIPPPTKSRYMAVHSLSDWQNPYITVQGDMLTLHVLMADANTSGMGEGGLLRPVGARRQDLNINVSDLAAALDAMPPNSWPYGRVIAVEEAHNTPQAARAQLRRDMEKTFQTLSDLGIVAYEWTDGGPSLR